jgi:hypothetical protein
MGTMSELNRKWLFALLLPVSSIALQGFAQENNVSATPSIGAVTRFEFGAQYTNRGLAAHRNSDGNFSSPPGRALGPSVALNINSFIAIDANLSQSPESDPSAENFSDGSVAGGRSLEVLVGPRFEVRGGRLGVFVAGRGGFLNWSHVLQDESYTSPYLTNGTLRYGAGYYPVIEAAAGVEVALTQRLRIRGEIGDQAIRYHTQTIEIPGSSTPQSSSWTSDGAFTRIGAFVNVGPVAGKSPDRWTPSGQHRLLDGKTILLLGVSLLSQTADYVASKRSIDSGGIETNGLARPFYNEGLGGILGLSIIVNATQVGIMYCLHRTGHHLLERLPPLAVIAGTTHGAYVSATR